MGRMWEGQDGMSLQRETRTMRRTALLLLAAVLLAACGARLSDEQRAALSTSGAEPGQQSGLVNDQATGDSDTTTTTGATDATQGGEPAAGGDDGASQSGGSAPGQAPAEGGGDQASSCAGGDNADVGVTAEEIKIGNVSTISGPIPGFGQTGVNAVKAYVNFVNATGGVCGRKLTLSTADDRLQSGTNKAQHDRLSQEVLGFVGGTSVVDDGAAQSLDGTNIAYTGLAITEAMITSPNNFPVSPINREEGGNGGLEIFKYMKEVEGVSRAGLVWPAQSSAKAAMDGYRTDMQRAGMDIVLETEVAVTETNYAGVAANVEGKQVDILITTLELSGMANLAKALEQNGYFPKVPFYGAQTYGRNFLAQAGSAAEPTVLGLGYSILEDAGSIPAIQDFITWYERTNPGADIDFFAIQSWIAADLYVSALRNISGPPTRDNLLASLKTFTEYDAGGFIAPINPAGKGSASCFQIAKVKDGEWYRAHPDQPGFDCSFA